MALARTASIGWTLLFVLERLTRARVAKCQRLQPVVLIQPPPIVRRLQHAPRLFQLCELHLLEELVRLVMLSVVLNPAIRTLIASSGRITPVKVIRTSVVTARNQ